MGKIGSLSPEALATNRLDRPVRFHPSRYLHRVRSRQSVPRRADGFTSLTASRPNRGEADQRRGSLISTLRSLTAEIGGARDELRSIDEQILGMQTVRKELLDAIAQQQDLLKSIEATADDRKELAELQARAAVLGVRSAVYERTTAHPQ